MKKTLFFILLIYPFIVFSQNDKFKNQLVYNQLIELDNYSKQKDINIDLKLNKLFGKIQNSKSDSLKGFYFLILANTLSDQLKKDEAIVAVSKSNQYYNKANNFPGIAKSWMNLGNIYLNRGDHDKALLYYNKALEIAEEKSLQKIMGWVNKNIGVVFMNQEKFKEALYYSNKSFKIFTSIDDKKELRCSLIYLI